MADNEIKYLGQGATEQLIQNTKSTATSKVADHNTSAEAHSDIRNALAETLRFSEQNLTEEQKSQTRANIGAIGYAVQIITWEEGD